MNNNEKEVVSRIANSPLKFYATTQSESTPKWDLPNPERIEIGITDGFDFGDALGK